ncbi:hypothetical protein ISN45_Aa03g004040 [Arabidopsis thaliana x Arabidopsis arenosa]|uniref:Defensin-like domain-containing protein n=2 Tax=Arabidopsis TaxID=3701 RepID=A0A8T2B214_ARASU|nr:hypothetical protein ISN45_Aa03g004040 [Arabidopsis thaliana x Arabidopsis arenosa]KAG7580630.1 hypothetical protein ISN44_As08g004120 [Arabidopsis suecica]
MGFTKRLVIFSLLVILAAVWLSTQSAMAAEIKATNGLQCNNPCTKKYPEYACNVDCITSGYATGHCISVHPPEPQYCCCY